MSTILIQRAHILSMDTQIGEIMDGDILIENDTIKQVGIHIEPTEEMEVIDGAGYIVMPGFVDTHRHVYQQLFSQAFTNWSLMDYFTRFLDDIGSRLRPQDIYVGSYIGYLEALNSGVTTVLHWANSTNTYEHGLEILKANSQINMRTIIAIADSVQQLDEDANFRKMLRLRDTNSNPLTQIALGAISLDVERFKRSISEAHAENVFATSHVGGAPGEEGLIEHLYEEGLPLNYINFAHCNQLSDKDYEIFAKENISVSITPEIEMLMGHGYPPFYQILSKGGRPSIGADTTSVVGADMITQLRVGLAYTHSVHNELVNIKGEEPSLGVFNAKSVLEMGTIDGARALRMEDQIGSLIPGKKADLIMINTTHHQTAPLYDPYNYVLMNAHAGNIEQVMINGHWVKKNGRLNNAPVDIDLLNDSTRFMRQELEKYQGVRV
ncbi:amidohydrolase family protein [Paenibacillus agilis]|uniref:Amidohydrolase family protein n=1 Tax=Paenibacillus agilis TaxID=3020863 RepID=A0A559IYU6_9BACL|nr:amidohydrolase family protein [Paenibacillus agilis]TVX92809.1 amidohydrolase family protein [Paenibacillus agilis]